MKTTSMKFLWTAIPIFLTVAALVLFFLPLGAAAATSGTTFTFTDSGITAAGSGSGWTIDGTALTVSEPGVYTLTGSCAEGSVTVKKGTTGVTLVLDGLELSSSTTAPISVNKGSEVTISLVGVSTLHDNESLANEDADEFGGAAIKVKSGASLTICGDGALNVDGACKNGIKGASLSAITVESGTVNVTAANNGIAADDRVTLAGGTITITAGNEGVKASPDEDDAESAGDILVTGGTITVTSGDDAFHADHDLTVTGGTFTVSAGDDAFHAEYTLTVDGGTFDITKCYEGFEGATVVLESGSAKIIASDDGVNAANSDLTGYTYSITVNGGSWYVDAGGDGLDVNGTLTINGGVTEVYGATNNGNAALDYDRSYVHNGGTLLAVGMSGMAQTPTSGSYVTFGATGMGGGMMGGFGGRMMQGAQMQSATVDARRGGMGEMTQGGMDAQTQGGVSIRAGDALEIRDSSGSVLYTATAAKASNSVLFASDALVSGGTYTLYVNGTAAATATVGTGSQQPGQTEEAGARPELNGQMPQMGARPELNGEMPQMGERPELNGEKPQMGERPERNGEMPQMGERPERNGQMPQMGERPERNGKMPQMGARPEMDGQMPQMDGCPGMGGGMPGMGCRPGCGMGQRPPMGERPDRMQEPPATSLPAA